MTRPALPPFRAHWFGFTTLDRSMFTQLLQLFVFSIALFCLIWLAPEILVRVLSLYLNHTITLPQFFQLLLYHVPEVLTTALPLAVLIGSIFLFRRLSMQSEWVAMIAAGIPPWRIIWPTLGVGLIALLCFVGVQEVIIPQWERPFVQMKLAVGLQRPTLDNFHYLERDANKHWKRFLLVESLPSQNAQATAPCTGLMILDYAPARSATEAPWISDITRAKTGRWLADQHAWELNDGVTYHLNAEGVFLASSPFNSKTLVFPTDVGHLLQYQGLSPAKLSMHSLGQLIRLQERAQQADETRYLQIRWHQKWAGPLACLVFTVLGVLLGVESTRSRNNWSLLFGAILIFVYSVSVPFTSQLGRIVDVPAPLVALLPLLLSCATAAGLLRLRAAR